MNGEETREIAYEIRQTVFGLSTEVMLDQKTREVLYNCGGLNTSLHATLPMESNFIGQHIFGRGEDFVKNMPHKLRLYIIFAGNWSRQNTNQTMSSISTSLYDGRCHQNLHSYDSTFAQFALFD